eukprot:1155180-Pelagomonas_calceolata.AAC.7
MRSTIQTVTPGDHGLLRCGNALHSGLRSHCKLVILVHMHANVHGITTIVMPGHHGPLHCRGTAQ